MKLNYLLLMVMTIPLTACTGFFDKDNTPEPRALLPIQTEITPKQRWVAHTKAVNDNNDYLKFTPSIKEGSLYTASTNGMVTSVNQHTGPIRWQSNTHAAITSGPSAGSGIGVPALRASFENARCRYRQ